MKIEINSTSKEITSVMLKDLSSYGGLALYLVAILLFAVANDFAFAYNLLVSLIVVSVVVAGVRLLYFKPRPGMKKKKYNVLYARIDNSSFPSIHAARSVLLSVALFSKFALLLPVLVVLVAAVLMSRIHMKRHDWIDLSVGSGLGLILGLVFFLL